MGEVVLSVICTTYGHEKYIRKALDSILMQKVNFPMEVLIGEDCSPDNSRDILKDYEKTHPGFFTVYYRDKNLGGSRNLADLINRSRGKYLAFLELDDYWTDCNKLQKQVNYLNIHNDVVAVAGRTVVVDKNGETIQKDYPECHSKFYKWKQYFDFILPGQLASIVCRNVFIEEGMEKHLINDHDLEPGDRKLAFIFLCGGKIYCIPEYMSAYRYVIDEGCSYSAKTHGMSKIEFYKQYTIFYKGLLLYANKYCKKSIRKNSEIMYSLYKFALYNEECPNDEKKSTIHYLFFDLDVNNKNRIRLFFLKQKIISVLKSK